jgi:hypothetical protein
MTIFTSGMCTAILAAVLSCGLRYEKEIENNDSLQTAMAVESGKPVKAAINGSGDIDYFNIAPEQRSVKEWDRIRSENTRVIAHIAVIPEGELDLSINIHHGSRVIKVIDDETAGISENGKEEFVNATFSPDDIDAGRAAFSVESVKEIDTVDEDAGIGYTLNVTLRGAQKDEEEEPNDKPVQATPFMGNFIMKGFFDPALNPLSTDETEKEVDWYAFRIPDTGKKEIRHLSLSAVPDVDTAISVYDELGYLIRRADSRGVGEVEKLMGIGFDRGKYLVKVENVGKPEKNTKVGYLLKIEPGDIQISEYEPNDRYIFASDIQFSRDLFGYFNPLEDVDWYRMSIYEPEPQIISVKISPTEDINPVIEFYASGEELILKSDDRGVDEGEIIKNMGVVEGIYYIKVYNRNSETDNPDNKYTLFIEKNVWLEDEEFEINDYPERANHLILNSLKRGYISPRGDRDIYSFNIGEDQAAGGGSRDVHIEISPCVLLDLRLNVYEENGMFVEEINNNAAEEGEREILSLEKGSYYVEVSSVNDFENPRDAYVLRIY